MYSSYGIRYILKQKVWKFRHSRRTKEMSGISTKIYAANVSELENEALYNAAYNRVTDERRKKTDSFRLKKDRQLSLGAELLLIEALKEWGINPKEIKYHYGANGKPYLTGRQDIYFNLSHSDEAVICAVSLWEVGCDIEKISHINLEVAKKFFCEAEYELIASRKTKESKQKMFFRLWTMKESFIKLTGIGMSMPMNSFSIKFHTDQILINQKSCDEKCYLQELDLWKDYKCAVCGFDKGIGIKGRVPFEILNLYAILNDN